MRKEKNTSGKAASKTALKERTIKNPAKAGSIDPSQIEKSVKKIAALRTSKMANSKS